MPRRNNKITRRRSDKISMNALFRKDKGVCRICGHGVHRSEANKTSIDAFSNGSTYKVPKLAHTECRLRNGS